MNFDYDETIEMINKLADEAQINGTALSKWEIGFVESVQEQIIEKKFLSPKQLATLEKIYDKMF